MKSEYSTKFGSPYPMGLSMRDGAINIVIEFPHSPKKVCGIILYTKNQEALRIPFSDRYRIGDLYCVRLEGPHLTDFSYQFYVDDVVLCDPYARRI